MRKSDYTSGPSNRGMNRGDDTKLGGLRSTPEMTGKSPRHNNAPPSDRRSAAKPAPGFSRGMGGMRRSGRKVVDTDNDDM